MVSFTPLAVLIAENPAVHQPSVLTPMTRSQIPGQLLLICLIHPMGIILEELPMLVSLQMVLIFSLRVVTNQIQREQDKSLVQNKFGNILYHRMPTFNYLIYRWLLQQDS